MAKKIVKTKMRAKKVYPERSREVPATQAMLYEVREELIERIEASKNELKGEISGLRGELKADIHGLKSDIHSLRGDVHRIALLVEDQNARNAIVLDGLTSLFARQDRVETEVRDLRKIVEQAK